MIKVGIIGATGYAGAISWKRRAWETGGMFS